MGEVQPATTNSKDPCGTVLLTSQEEPRTPISLGTSHEAIDSLEDCMDGKVYTCNIINAVFAKRSENKLDRQAFDRSLSDQIVDGGEVGVWKVSTRNGNVITLLTVVGMYAKTYWLSENIRVGESIQACWSWSETRRIKCCDCGCPSCADCQCCCKTCDECSECVCCCDCEG